MDIRGVTDTGDWTFGRGAQNYARLDDAIMTDIATKLKMYQGEAFWNTDAGIPWFSLLGQKRTDPLVYEIRKAVLGVNGVIRVNSVSVELDAQRRALLQYSVDTIYSSRLQGSVLV